MTTTQRKKLAKAARELDPTVAVCACGASFDRTLKQAKHGERFCRPCRCKARHERAQGIFSPRRLTVANFWARVDKSGECWVWTAARDNKGYGHVSVGGHLQKAHRVAYGFAVGPVPAGLLVLHRCDNPPCVNPAHLFVGTYSDNMRDMTAKGRGRPRGKPARNLAMESQ